jgi:hypothetical protein
MKINIKREEIRQILCDYFRCEVEDFVINLSVPSTLGRQLRNTVPEPESKNLYVANIKAIRSLGVSLGVYLTLSESKWAVENWNTFLRFVDENNRFPVAGYGTVTERGILR